MGASFVSEVDNQSESKSSKTRRAFLVESGNYYEANYRVFHNSAGAPRYLTGMTAFFRRHGLTQGDVLIMNPMTPGTVGVEVHKASSQVGGVAWAGAAAVVLLHAHARTIRGRRACSMMCL